ncbi:MAG: ferritin-like domain-containing protein [Planctomycetota bacterium]|jgi:hypothetical protein
MDIFEFAMQKEKLSEQHYRELAGKTDKAGLKNIFIMLADEESKHYEAIRQMKTKTPEQITDTDVLSESKDIFEHMSGQKDNYDYNAKQLSIYEQARQHEKNSMDFYLEKAGQVEDPRQKEIFKKLAAEEKKHYFLLDNIIDFLSRPEQWLENAEFCHLEEY